jgi:hypothetical protein
MSVRVLVGAAVMVAVIFAGINASEASYQRVKTIVQNYAK